MAAPVDSFRRSPEEEEEPPVGWGARLLRATRLCALTLLGVSAIWLGLGTLRAPDLPAQSPKLILENLDGVSVDLASFRGQTVLVNFWATWCTSCGLEMPMLVNFAQSHPDVPVLFVAVDGSVEKLVAYADRENMSRQRVLRMNAAAKASWPVSTLPTTVVIGPDGAIRTAHAGIVAPPQLWWWGR